MGGGISAESGQGEQDLVALGNRAGVRTSPLSHITCRLCVRLCLRLRLRLCLCLCLYLYLCLCLCFSLTLKKP